MMKNKLFIIIFLVLFSFKSYSYNQGQTYPIAEPNMLLEMQEKMKNIDFNKIRKEYKKKILEYSTKTKFLPTSEKSFEYLHDIIFTLPYDIPRVDRTGKVIGILYPKGFTYHVLRYVPYDIPPLVFFDIKNPLQKQWVKKKYGKNVYAYLISTTGTTKDVLDFAKELKRSVYMNQRGFRERFGLKYTISIVTRDKKNRDCVRVKVVGMKEIKKDLKEHNSNKRKGKELKGTLRKKSEKGRTIRKEK